MYTDAFYKLHIIFNIQFPLRNDVTVRTKTDCPTFNGVQGAAQGCFMNSQTN